MKAFTYTINAGGRLLDLSEPKVMGILNATPDSFFAGSRRQTEAEIADRANEIVEQGGEIIDVGAFSTRPGAAEVSCREETERLRRALAIVRREQPDAVLSVDTYRPSVARMCVEEFGADIINDVSEGGITGIVNTPIHEEESMFETVARLSVAYILMSVKPDLYSMMKAFAEEVQQLRDLGVKDVILDPGFGFSKTVEQNFRLLGEMHRLGELGYPVLAGISRKSMIYKTLDTTPDDALAGTTALHWECLRQGASILRVHDTREAAQIVALYERYEQSNDR